MKNEYRVTWERYRSWIMERMFKGEHLVIMFFWCIMIVICIAAASVTGLPIFFLIVGLFCFYRAFFRNLLVGKKQYNMLTRHYKSRDWLRSIQFQEDGIALYEESSFVKYEYDRIVNIREKGDQISLDLDDKSVLRLYHSTFVEGDWDGCKKLIDTYLEKKRDEIRQERECNPEKFYREQEEIKNRLQKRIRLLVLAIFIFLACIVVTVIMNRQILRQEIDSADLEMIECDVTDVIVHKVKANTRYDYYTVYQGKEQKIQTSDYSLKKGMHIKAYLYKGKIYADELSIQTNSEFAYVYYVFLGVDMVAFYFMILEIAYVKQDIEKRKNLEKV